MHGQALDLSMVGPRFRGGLYAGPKKISLDTPAWFDAWNDGSRVVSGQTFTDCVITANSPVGAVFVDCLFDGTTFGGDGSGLELVHCGFDARAKPARAAMWHALFLRTYTARDCLFRGWDIGLRLGVNCLVDRCLISDIKAQDPVIKQHQSCVSAQQLDISGSVLRRSKLLAAHTGTTDPSGISTALSHYNDGTHTGLVIEDNYIATSSYYGMYGGAQASKPDPFSTNLKIRGNVFGREFGRYAALAAPARAFNNADPANEWAVNVWGPLGPFNRAGDPAEGTLIPAPSPGA